MDRPKDECGEAARAPGDCLWRVVGFDVARREYTMLVGLVRAPRRDIALTIAVSRYGRTHRDIQIRGEPIPDDPLVEA